MKKVLLISSTSNSNLKLAHKLSNIFKNLSSFNVEVVNIEKYQLPLFNPSRLDEDKKNNLNKIIKITDQMVSADAFVICTPEYNGNVPPVLSNAIAWISVTTSYWKDGFKNKLVLIASSSGGEAEKMQISLSNQMNYLGSVVFKQKIIINSKSLYDKEKSKNIINEFIKVL